MPTQPSQRGKGLPEYAVILVLVLVSIVSLVVTFGDDLRQLFDNPGTSAAATANVAGNAPKAPAPTTGGTTGS